MKTALTLLIILFMTVGMSCSSKLVQPPAEGVKLAKSAQAVKGQEIFMRNCNRCHPGGMAGLGPTILNKPRFVIRFQVRNGLGVMPSFDKKRISKADLVNLVEYLKER
jgi:mono/diheme cytochrome c family protein